VLTFIKSDVNSFIDVHLKEFADVVDQFLILFTHPGFIKKIPEAVINIKLRLFREGHARELENVEKVWPYVLPGKVIFKAMKGEINLTNGLRLKKEVEIIA